MQDFNIPAGIHELLVDKVTENEVDPRTGDRLGVKVEDIKDESSLGNSELEESNRPKRSREDSKPNEEQPEEKRQKFDNSDSSHKELSSSSSRSAVAPDCSSDEANNQNKSASPIDFVLEKQACEMTDIFESDGGE